MAAGISIEIQGYAHAKATLSKYEARQLRNRLNRAVAAGGRMVRDAQRAAAPIGAPGTDRYSGETRRSIAVKSMRSGGVKIGPVGKDRRQWTKIAAVVYGRKKGRHGTTPGHPFVTVGSNAVRGSVARIIRDAAVKG